MKIRASVRTGMALGLTLVVFLVAGCGLFAGDKAKQAGQAAVTKNQQEQTAQPKQEPQGPMGVKPNTKAQINEPVVNVRSGPSVKTNKLRQLKKGDPVTILKATQNDEKEVWYEINLPDGQSGYIRNDLLTISDSEASASAGKVEAAKGETAKGDTAKGEAARKLGDVDKDSLERTLSGKWRAKQFFVPGVSAMPLPEAAKWMGRVGTIAMNKIDFAPNTYEGVALKGQLYKTKDYFKNDLAMVEHFKITSEQVWAVESGKTGPMASFVVVGDQFLLSQWDGVYFLWEKEK